MTKNFEAFTRLDTRRYADRYVVLVNRRVVASGDDLPSLLARVRRKYPGQRPLVAKIPQRGALILRGR